MKLLLALAALTLNAETRVSTEQIRNWQQVRNPSSVGTAIAISQLRVPPDAMEVWQWLPLEEGGHHFRVATVLKQQLPILIVCMEPLGSCVAWQQIQLKEDSREIIGIHFRNRLRSPDEIIASPARYSQQRSPAVAGPGGGGI